MSNMAKLWPTTLHTTELSLLASIIFYSNSLVMLCDYFLISYQYTTIITLLSLTCFFLVICDFLIKGNKSFEALYWNFYFLMAASLLHAPESKDWNFSRGLYSLLLGFTILSLYTLYTWIIPPQQGQDQQEENRSPGSVVPLAVEISFVFTGNGIALMGRLCFFQSDELILAGAGLMFLASAVFFTCYYMYSSVKPSVPVNLHED